MPPSSRRLATAVLVILVGLSRGASRATAAACPSTCTQQLKECKQTCGGSGQARRDCRAVCGERSTCTAPGASIRTLAYVVTECTTDPQGRSSVQQKLLIRRGNCDPITAMEAAPPTPVPDPPGVCGVWGKYRTRDLPYVAGVFPNMAVLPNGSGVVFEVSNDFAPFPALSPEPPEEGVFFVRADGSELRRLGPASRVPPFYVVSDGSPPLGVSFPVSIFIFTGGRFSSPVSPNGRTIAHVDLGPSDDTDRHEAPQIFLLDLPSGRQRQLTHQSRLASWRDAVFWSATFVDRRTIDFYDGIGMAYQVKTDGNGDVEDFPPRILPGGGRIVSQFEVIGAHPHVVGGFFPDKPSPPFGLPALELFLIDGKHVLQLTNFGRSDTGNGGGFIARGRAFFAAAANPLGENPAGLCQIFSINTSGGGLRQLTHLPWDGRSSIGCSDVPFGGGCEIDPGFKSDQVTGTVLFWSSCDPTGGNPLGAQIFAMRPDGTGLRQLTNARGMTTDPDGTVHVEMVAQSALWSTPR